MANARILKSSEALEEQMYKACAQNDTSPKMFDEEEGVRYFSVVKVCLAEENRRKDADSATGQEYKQ